MKKRTVKLLFLNFVLMFAICASALFLAACNADKNDGSEQSPVGGNEEPSEVILTPQQAKNALGLMRVPKNTDVRVSMGNYVVDVSYRLNNTEYFYLYSKSDNGRGGWKDTYINLKGARYVKVESAEDGNQDMRYLSDWELSYELAKFKKAVDISAKDVESTVINEHYEAERVLGKAAGEVNYSGYKRGKGDFEIKMNAVVIKNGLPFVCDFTFTATEGNRLTKMTADFCAVEGYYPDDDAAPTLPRVEVDIEYGPHSNNVTGRHRSYPEVQLNFANGARMPSSFNALINTELTAGSTVVIPSPINEIGFTGWFYDRELRYPIPKNPNDYSGNSYLLTISDGVPEMTVYPRFHKKDSGSPFLSNINVNNAFSEEDRAKIEYTFLLSDYTKIIPNRSGYTFSGWYKDKDLTVPLTENDTVIAYSETLYPKLIKNVTVSFSADLSYALLPLEGCPGSAAGLPIPSKKGYVFDGWFTDEGLNNRAEADFPDEDATYYAKFSPA